MIEDGERRVTPLIRRDQGLQVSDNLYHSAGGNQARNFFTHESTYPSNYCQTCGSQKPCKNRCIKSQMQLDIPNFNNEIIYFEINHAE